MPTARRPDAPCVKSVAGVPTHAKTNRTVAGEPRIPSQPVGCASLAPAPNSPEPCAAVRAELLAVKRSVPAGRDTTSAATALRTTGCTTASWATSTSPTRLSN